MDNEMIERIVDVLRKHHVMTKPVAAIIAVEVIAAMREPTEKMMKAFDAARPMYDDSPTTGDEYWKEGIDAIIKE